MFRFQVDLLGSCRVARIASGEEVAFKTRKTRCLLGLLRWGRKIVEEVCFDGGGFRGRGASAQLLVLDILVRKSYLKERAT